MDDLHDKMFQAGRSTGIANAVTAVCRVAERYKGQHEAWMALMEAIREIQEIEES